MHYDIPQDCYDNFNRLPVLDVPTKSILEVFLNQVRDRPNHRFFGTRQNNGDGSFGAYQWDTYQDIFVKYEEIAKGCKALQLLQNVPGVNEDGKEWAFCGIWAKNRWEWHTTMLSAMVCKATVIGFYDSMGDSSVDYCLKQTKLETMFVTAAYLKKMLGMRDQGLATFIKNIVLFDTDQESMTLMQRAKNEYQIRVFTLDEVREAGRASSVAL